MTHKAHRRPRLRLWGRRVLANWLCLLRTGADLLDPGAAHQGRGTPGRQVRVMRNRELQEEFRQVFGPFHRFCPECGSKCCREPQIPFSALDRLVLEGARAGRGSEGAKEGAGPRRLLRCFEGKYLRRKLASYTAAAPKAAGNGAGFCPALGAVGCRLPWGERPAACVFCACPRILAEMDRRTYGRYIWISLKYFANLSLFLGAQRVRQASSGRGALAG